LIIIASSDSKTENKINPILFSPPRKMCLEFNQTEIRRTNENFSGGGLNIVRLGTKRPH
jgi:hypothetical protein